MFQGKSIAISEGKKRTCVSFKSLGVKPQGCSILSKRCNTFFINRPLSRTYEVFELFVSKLRFLYGFAQDFSVSLVDRHDIALVLTAHAITTSLR